MSIVIHLPRIPPVSIISVHECHMDILLLALNGNHNGLSSVFCRLRPMSTGEIRVTVSRTDRGDREPFVSELYAVEGSQSIVRSLALFPSSVPTSWSDE
jgi:hypothetical protein